MSPPVFEVEWDDGAQGWRVGTYDHESDVWNVLPGPGRAAEEHPWLAGSCAAALAATSSESDDEGMLWESEGNEYADAQRACAAATAAMSDLSKAERGALAAIVALGMPIGSSKRTLDSLRAKHLIDDKNKATPAGRVRARGQR